ncbi:uncharacterized protein LOC144141466 [Haemaphysalis longicornis]
MAECLLKTYMDRLLTPLNYTVISVNFPWIFAQLVDARLALDLYLELYRKISSKSDPSDSGVFVRGFSPFQDIHMAFVFYAENSCEPLPTLNTTHRFLTHGISPRDKVRVALASLPVFTTSFRCWGTMPMRAAVPSCSPWNNG